MLNSLKFKFVLQTSKLFDDREDKNIWKLINICKNQHEEFLKVIENSYIDEHGNESRKFIREVHIMKELEAIENRLHQYDVQIKNIKSIRDTVLAHSDKEYFYDNNKAFDIYSIKYNDIDEMLTLLHEVLNGISICYNGKAYGEFASSIDDFKNMLEHI